MRFKKDNMVIRERVKRKGVGVVQRLRKKDCYYAKFSLYLTKIHSGVFEDVMLLSTHVKSMKNKQLFP